MRDIREEYQGKGLSEADLLADPVEQVRLWVEEAVNAGLPVANAMTLATVNAEGQPSARTVLLKGVEQGGFVFFSHYDSRKGDDIEASDKVAFVLYWSPMDRQITVQGRARKVDAEISRAYFKTRPYGSQISAVASPQSRPVDLETLEADVAQLRQEYPEGSDIPMPENWGGYLIVPEEIQFWQGRPNRLHDRVRYFQEEGKWLRERLAP